MIECIGIVSPGAMGTEVGRTLAGLGSRVVVALEGRSDRSRSRAIGAGLDDVGSMREVVRAADVVLSIVPPAFAVEVASQLARCMAETESRPVVVDANAISPSRRAACASGSSRSTAARNSNCRDSWDRSADASGD